MWRTRLCPVQGREEDRVVVVRRGAACKLQKGKNKEVRNEVGCCRSRWRSYTNVKNQLQMSQGAK